MSAPDDLRKLADDPEACVSGTPMVPIQQSTLRALLDERDRLTADITFLHQRRGELAIERDRYAAALGKYPDGRDVLFAGALAEIETLRAENAELRKDEPA